MHHELYDHETVIRGKMSIKFYDSVGNRRDDIRAVDIDRVYFLFVKIL